MECRSSHWSHLIALTNNNVLSMINEEAFYPLVNFASKSENPDHGH